MDDLWVEKVLRAVELVPRGEVATYGDLGSIVGRGPRFVGNVMGRHGSGVPWWRITNASGELPPGLLATASEHWREEGITLKPNGRGCHLASHRTNLGALAAAWTDATLDLSEDAGTEADN